MRRILVTASVTVSLSVVSAAARAQSVPAQGSWSARVDYVDVYTDTNAGHASDHAPSSGRSSSGGLQGRGWYGWFYTTENWKKGAGGVYLDGTLRWDGEPGLSLFSPALAAQWHGAFHRHGDALPLDYRVEAEVRHDSYSLHLRDGWTRHAEAELDWNQNGKTQTNWQGYADYPFFDVFLGGEIQRHDSTASLASQRAVFDGTSEDLYLGFAGRLVAHDSMSPLRFLKGVSVMGTYRMGDFVSTGPATADVVAAARAAVPDDSVGTATPPNESYRLRGSSMLLEARIRVARPLQIGWTHEVDSARAGFKATSELFYLRID